MCTWINELSNIGNLLDEDLEDILMSDKAEAFYKRLVDCKYHELSCDSGYCPYINNNVLDKLMTEYEGCYPYPENLSLAFEHRCNYRCVYCASSKLMEDFAQNDYEKNLDIIEARLKKVLPYVKNIVTNGNGEIFCSTRILKLLSEWKPLAPKEEVSAWLETNGSLFDEKTLETD